jgi:hypothetical protein
MRSLASSRSCVHIVILSLAACPQNVMVKFENKNQIRFDLLSGLDTWLFIPEHAGYSLIPRIVVACNMNFSTEAMIALAPD